MTSGPARAGTTAAPPSHRRALGLLALPAALLAILIFGSALAIAVVTGGGAADVEARLPDWIPWIIAANHTLVFGVLLAALRDEGRSLGDIGWTRLRPAGLAREIALGLVVSAATFGLERRVIDPVGRLLEGTAADVGGGGVDVSGVPLAWLVVAVVFPFVEETVYRGYGIGLYRRRIGLAGAVVVSTALFGLLHWGQGTWGMVDTALLGLVYAGAWVWRGSLWAPTVGHAGYNAATIVAATWL